MRALGYLLRHEIVSMTAFATADIVATRLQDMLDMGKQNLEKTLVEERVKLETPEE